MLKKVVGLREPTEILRANAGGVSAPVLDQGNLTLLSESIGDTERCDRGRPRREPEHIIGRDECWYNPKGRLISVREVESKKTTAFAIGIDGENRRTVLVPNMQVFADGSHIAYLEQQIGHQQLYLVETESGRRIEATDELRETRGVTYGFMVDQPVPYYIAYDRDGWRKLYTSDNPERITEGILLRAAPAPADSLAHVVGAGSSQPTWTPCEVRRTSSC